MFVDTKDEAIKIKKVDGYESLVIGQPLAGKDVPKATYASCINMFSPMAMIELLQKYKVTGTVKILGDFPIDANRNRFVEESIEAGADYLFFMDMDQTFPPATLLNLFEIISDERPIVGGMYYLKKEPYPPVLGRYVDWEEDMIPHKEYYAKEGFVHPDGRQLCTWRPITYYDKTNPFQVDVIGLGCVLMKVEVFKDLEYPYFRYARDPRPDRKKYMMDEVMHFCAQLKKKNIPIWIDPRVQCGHIATLETNSDLYESCRDYQFSASAKESPEGFDKIAKLFIDVREEQKNDTRFWKKSI